MFSVTFVHSFFYEKDAKVLYDKLESLLHEKYDNATYKSQLEGSFLILAPFKVIKVSYH